MLMPYRMAVVPGPVNKLFGICSFSIVVEFQTLPRRLLCMWKCWLAPGHLAAPTPTMWQLPGTLWVIVNGLLLSVASGSRGLVSTSVDRHQDQYQWVST